MKRLRNIRFAHIAGCLFLFAALGVLACLLYPELEWRHRMTKMLRDAPYVKLYNPDYELVATIEDRDTIQRLWAAMDLWKRESATADGELIQVGCIQYPTELEWEPGVPFEFPITLYADGRALWGLTPDSRHWFWSKELRDEVVRLLEQHSQRAKNRAMACTRTGIPLRSIPASDGYVRRVRSDEKQSGKLPGVKK